jgi:ribosomal protein S18 acetylase RimI-like enzyme
MRFPHLAHRSAAAHKLHSTPQQHGMILFRGMIKPAAGYRPLAYSSPEAVQTTGTVVTVLEEKADHLLVYSVAVKPDAQQKGYGTALLDFADQRAIGLGLRELRLYTNERMEWNLRLYRRHGFVEVGKRPHSSRPGQVLIDMVRQLEPPKSEVEQG